MSDEVPAEADQPKQAGRPAGAPQRVLLYRAHGQVLEELARTHPAEAAAIISNLGSEEYRYARWGLVSGAICVMVGAGLTLLGAGAASLANWNVSLFKLSSSVAAATPGAICMIVGYLFVASTRPEVDLSRDGGGARKLPVLRRFGPPSNAKETPDDPADQS